VLERAHASARLQSLQPLPSAAMNAHSLHKSAGEIIAASPTSSRMCFSEIRQRHFRRVPELRLQSCRSYPPELPAVEVVTDRPTPLAIEEPRDHTVDLANLEALDDLGRVHLWLCRNRPAQRKRESQRINSVRVRLVLQAAVCSQIDSLLLSARATQILRDRPKLF
jgi:hypothetical protein